jgi:hypothetical protein
MATQRAAVDVVIANGGTTSSNGNLDRGRLVGIQMPAAWTAGGLTIQALAADGATFVGLVDKAHAALGAVTSPAANDYIVFLPADHLECLGIVRLVAGAAQGAARTIRLIVALD